MGVLYCNKFSDKFCMRDEDVNDYNDDCQRKKSLIFVVISQMQWVPFDGSLEEITNYLSPGPVNSNVIIYCRVLRIVIATMGRYLHVVFGRQDLRRPYNNETRQEGSKSVRFSKQSNNALRALRLGKLELCGKQTRSTKATQPPCWSMG